MPREKGFWAWLTRRDRDWRSWKGFTCLWGGIFTIVAGIVISAETWTSKPGAWVPVGGIGVLVMLYGIYLLEEG